MILSLNMDRRVRLCGKHELYSPPIIRWASIYQQLKRNPSFSLSIPPSLGLTYSLCASSISRVLGNCVMDKTHMIRRTVLMEALESSRSRRSSVLELSGRKQSSTLLPDICPCDDIGSHRHAC